MFKAGLAKGSADTCSEALGMGAAAKMPELACLEEKLGFNSAEKVALS